MSRLALVFTALFLISCTPEAEDVATISSDVQADSNEVRNTEMTRSISDVSFTSISGTTLPFADFLGGVTLVVNTASRCGYTGQYSGLQELYETFQDQGFTVLGVPSNDFGGQEPGTEAQIMSFCEINYGVDFPLTKKTAVVGPDQHDFWRLAKASLGEKAEPQWNFHKVLVGRDGGFVQAYPSAVRPVDAELVADIESALAASD